LPGANVFVLGIEPVLGTTTDADGRFVLPRVPIGRHSIRISFLGYEPAFLPDALVTAGKELVIEVALQEQVLAGEEIVVVADASSDQPLNDLALVSARSFSVEETRRYAGGLDDPARMASAFAGIASAGGVQGNALAIRGNSPKGVVWRLQGVEIPNPNHFAGLSVAGGGGITLFSSQLLAASDVLTGAFPATYGNALAGVFDIRFRRGNAARREHTVQLGLVGLEGASEGPFRRGGEASYLVNYRFSTLGILQPLLPTESATTFQDLAFHVELPTRSAGRFNIWGMGGLDRQTQRATRDSTAWEYEFWDRVDAELALDVGAAGITHHAILGPRTYLQSHLATTLNRTRWDWVRLDDSLRFQPDLFIDSEDRQIVAGIQLTHKFGPRHTIESSVATHRLGYGLTIRDTPAPGLPALTVAVGKSHAFRWNAGVQSRWRPTDRLTATLGFHLHHFGLTRATSLEPRLGAQWRITARQTISFGAGRHSQIEELRVYFADPQRDGRLPNRSLDLARAHHYVLGYHLALDDVRRVRIEVYQQYLFDVPVTPDSSFSMLNFEQDWGFAAALEATGAGTNRGIEFTLERAFRDGWYALVTASLFDARYRDGNGLWRSSRFDQDIAVNTLAGREFSFRNGRRRLGLNGRFIGLGGKRRSPVDQDASRRAQEVVFDERFPFSEREPSTILVDLTLTYRVDHPHRAHTWALQLKNALGAEDRSFDYNFRTRRVEVVREGFPLPVVSYKLEF
jgi:hypothetical protein